MNRKAPWTTAFPEQVKCTPKRAKQRKARKPIRRVSKRRAVAMAEYRKEAVMFLLEVWTRNWRCPVIFDAPATEIHHKRGRLGKLLMDKRYWIAVSPVGHRWIHNNPGLARRAGLLCQPGEWNRPDETP